MDADLLPAKFTGHVLFSQARNALRDCGIFKDWFTSAGDPLDETAEDMLSEAVLALLEGRDPVQAAREYLAPRPASAATRSGSLVART